jgi:hypothetical protein
MRNLRPTAQDKPPRIKPELAADQFVFGRLQRRRAKGWKPPVAYYKSQVIDHDLLMGPDEAG